MTVKILNFPRFFPIVPQLYVFMQIFQRFWQKLKGPWLLVYFLMIFAEFEQLSDQKHFKNH
jgi:hypothetical protein